MPGKALVLDANILIRAVLGKRVREAIEKYAEDVSFFVPNLPIEVAIPMTGRYSPRRWPSGVRYGLRTPISSVVE